MAFFTVEGLGLLLIPKAASSSIQNAIVANGIVLSEINRQQFLGLERRVAFMREPHERIESAYRWYLQYGEDERHDLSSFPAFIQSICLNHHNNPHVMPQWELIQYGEPTEIIGWDFKKLSNILGIDSIPQHNMSPSAAIHWDKRTRKLFDEVEANSLGLWETING